MIWLPSKLNSSVRCSRWCCKHLINSSFITLLCFFFDFWFPKKSPVLCMSSLTLHPPPSSSETDKFLGRVFDERFLHMHSVHFPFITQVSFRAKCALRFGRTRSHLIASCFLFSAWVMMFIVEPLCVFEMCLCSRPSCWGYLFFLHDYHASIIGSSLASDESHPFLIVEWLQQEERQSVLNSKTSKIECRRREPISDFQEKKGISSPPSCEDYEGYEEEEQREKKERRQMQLNSSWNRVWEKRSPVQLFLLSLSLTERSFFSA